MAIDELKDDGKRNYASGDFKQAIKSYSDAILLCPTEPVLYSNRAMSYIKLSDWQSALNDCNTGLSLDADPKIKVKLLWRRATCLSKLDQQDEAEKSLKYAQEIDPKNRAVIKDLDALAEKRKKRKILVDLKVEQVDHLPSELSQFDPTVEIDYEEQLRNIEGVTVPTPKQSEPAPKRAEPAPELDVPDEITVYYLSTLPRKVTDAQRDSYYQYVLQIDTDTYSKLFEKAGVDHDFLNFYIDAALWDLDRSTPQYSAKIVADIETFTKMPRFMITTMYVDTAKSSRLLQQIQDQTGTDLHYLWK